VDGGVRRFSVEAHRSQPVGFWDVRRSARGEMSKACHWTGSATFGTGEPVAHSSFGIVALCRAVGGVRTWLSVTPGKPGGYVAVSARGDPTWDACSEASCGFAARLAEHPGVPCWTLPER
jgi:hypothetical protein